MLSTSNEPSHTSSKPSLALVCGDGRTTCELALKLQRSLGQFECSGAAEGLADSSPYDLVAIHFDALSEADRRLVIERLRAPSRPPTLFLFERCSTQEFIQLLDTHSFHNMLVVNECGVDASDLVVTVGKLRTGDIFGLEKYFVWGVAPRTIRVVSSTQTKDVLDEIVEHARGLGVGERLRGTICTVVDEFLSNALYDAPVTRDGRPRFLSQSRALPVDLAPSEAVEIRYCCDGRRFGISAADPFGSLSPTMLQAHLARTFRRGEDQVNDASGGAGVGLYQIFGSLSHFIINIEPGARTEMIGLVDVSGSYRSFASSGRSFNIFVKGGEKRHAAPPVTSPREG